MGKPPASHSLTTKAPYRCVYIMRNGCFPSELLGGEAGIKCLLNAGCVPFFWPRTLVFKRVTSSDSNFLGQVWTDIIDCSLYLPSRFTSECCMPLFPNRNILLVKCQNLTQRDHARTLIRKHVTLLLCCFAAKSHNVTSKRGESVSKVSIIDSCMFKV